MNRGAFHRGILVLSALSLVLGPMLFVLFLGSGIGYGLGIGITVIGGGGLWIGMKAVERGGVD